MKRYVLSLCVLATFLTLSATEQRAYAQFNSGSSRSVRNATRNFLYNRPTVSPYLNLTSRSASSGLPRYYTDVRPQVEARQRSATQQRQSAQMQSQLDQVQNQVRQTQQSAAGTMITGQAGWSARGFPRFGTYMSFYPGFQRIPRR